MTLTQALIERAIVAYNMRMTDFFRSSCCFDGKTIAHRLEVA